MFSDKSDEIFARWRHFCPIRYVWFINSTEHIQHNLNHHQLFAQQTSLLEMSFGFLTFQQAFAFLIICQLSTNIYQECIGVTKPRKRNQIKFTSKNYIMSVKSQ